MVNPGVVQPADRKKKKEENLYEKHYKKKSAISERLPRKAKQEHSLVRSGKPSQRQQRLSGILQGPTDPGYNPSKDNALGVKNKVWDGRRGSLKWFDNVQTAMAATRNQCDVQKHINCSGQAEGIDHKQDFADLQTGLTRYVICDGLHHFSACYKVDALELFNGGNSEATAVLLVDTTNLRWSCASCNSSKGGTKGVYENVPKWIEPCPGNCGYAFKGEVASD